jgi:hypothetical protein
VWETRLKNLGIMNLLEIPHFGCSLEINSYVKLLLSYIHGGTLWLDPPISIDIALIVWITWPSKSRENLTTLFKNKEGRALS